MHAVRSPLWLLVLALAAGCASSSAEARPVSASDLSRSFEGLSEHVSRGVVHIRAAGYVPVADPGGQVLSKKLAAGSGVALSEDGYIMTNAHVVSMAERVEVRLYKTYGDRPSDSIIKPRGDYVPAKVVGIDPETDLALLKVDQTIEHALELGDSDTVRPGQIVFAFGSPRGLEGSVTMGVVSATARQLQEEGTVVYIQTDAPINPGNSGGPLVNSDGRVVGINSLILSESGGSEGLGFAVPSNIVKTIYEGLKDQGSIQRGIIGAVVQTITPPMAEGLGLNREWGVVVADVFPNSPAARAGMEPGDIIVSLNGKPMENARQFDVNVYHTPIGGFAVVRVLRDGAEESLRIPVIERPRLLEQLQVGYAPEDHLVPQLGILGITLDDNLRKLVGGLRDPSGVVVATAPLGHSLRQGDVIHEVNTQKVSSLEELRAQLAAKPSGEPIVLRVERGGALRYITLELN